MKAEALVARNIRRLRVARELSQEMLAVDAGIDRTYVSRLERGLVNPSVAVLEKLARARCLRISRNFSPHPAPGKAARRLVRGAKHESMRGSLPANVLTLRASRPRPPSTVAIIEGLKLMQIFLRIETGAERKRVLDLAKQLAPNDANRKT
jgi:transcriptional regulator with XRE-family HTH domain